MGRSIRMGNKNNKMSNGRKSSWRYRYTRSIFVDKHNSHLLMNTWNQQRMKVPKIIIFYTNKIKQMNNQMLEYMTLSQKFKNTSFHSHLLSIACSKFSARMKHTKPQIYMLQYNYQRDLDAFYFCSAPKIQCTLYLLIIILHWLHHSTHLCVIGGFATFIFHK